MKPLIPFIENYRYDFAILNKYGIVLNDFPDESYEQSSTSFHFCVVGLFIHRDYRIMVYPKNYKEPNDIKDQHKETANLIKSIQKYNRKSKKSDLIYQSTNGKLSKRENYIGSMIFIIEHYLNHGLIYREQKEFKKNSNKKIHWNKTMSSVVPDVFNSTTVYLDTYSNVKMKDYDNDITRLHKLALIESLYQLGFLFNMDYSHYDYEYYELNNDFTNHKNKYEYQLQMKLSNTFNDTTLELLNNIKSILFDTSLSETKHKIIPIITFNFELVWQDVVSECFKNEVKRYQEYFPSLDIIYKSVKEHRPQLPDVVYQSAPNSWYILDAKYYDVDFNRPSKGDYLKQYFYEFSFKYNGDSITNALIFNTNGADVEYLGNALIKEATNPFLKDKTIHMIGLNQRAAYEYYSKNQSTNYYRSLITDVIHTNNK